MWLARELGMTTRELLHRMDSGELAEQMAYDLVQTESAHVPAPAPDAGPHADVEAAIGRALERHVAGRGRRRR